MDQFELLGTTNSLQVLSNVGDTVYHFWKRVMYTCWIIRDLVDLKKEVLLLWWGDRFRVGQRSCHQRERL